MGRSGRWRGSAAIAVVLGILAIAVAETLLASGLADVLGGAGVGGASTGAGGISTGVGGLPTPAPSSPQASASVPQASPVPGGTTVPTAPRVPAEETGIGKGVSLRHGHHAWGENPAALESDLADVAAVGADWIRVRLDYSPAPDADFDRLVELASARGIRLLVTLGKPDPARDLGTPEDRALFRRWVTATVERYRDRVHHWELLNEPNLHAEWAIDEATADDTAYRAAVLRYLTLLRDAHEAIVAADPGAVVHFGGLSEWTLERFLRVVLSTDAHRYFDVLDVHPYGRDPDAVVARYRAARELLAMNPDYADKPVWITELGFNTTWPHLPGYVRTEGEKARRLRVAISLLRSDGMRLPIFWYTLHENDRSPGFGLLVKDPVTLRTTYLPAYTAYRDLRDPGVGAWYDTPQEYP